MASQQTIAFLLDYAPQTWCSRDDYHVQLCQTLAEHDVDSVLVFAKDVPDDMARLIRARKVEAVTIDYSKGIKHYYTELGELIKRYSVTAAHICYFDYFSIISWLARLRGIEFIIYEAVNSGELKARSLKKHIIRFRNRMATKPVSHVIAISLFVKSQLVAGGLSGNKVFVRYLGVDNKRFVPNPAARQKFIAEFRLPDGDLLLSTVSFLKPFKNPQMIIEACGLLAARGIPFHLFVAGEGMLRGELELLAQRLDISNRVHWLGHYGDPKSLLQASDIFVLTSIGEAFGLVLPEAMACGLPVVATRSGGIVEIVEDKETGFLINPSDTHALADALQELAESPELRQQMGEKGIERVKQKFTVDDAVNNTVKIYESMGMISSPEITPGGRLESS